MPVLVLDCSATLSVAFEDEYSDDAWRVFEAIEHGGALVPPLWPMEVAHALRNGIKHGRISEPDAERFLDFLAEYPVEVYDEKPHPLPSVFFQSAKRHSLTAYDASYLRLAQITGLPLAANDGELVKAARKAGVTLFA